MEPILDSGREWAHFSIRRGMPRRAYASLRNAMPHGGTETAALLRYRRAVTHRHSLTRSAAISACRECRIDARGSLCTVTYRSMPGQRLSSVHREPIDVPVWPPHVAIDDSVHAKQRAADCQVSHPHLAKRRTSGRRPISGRAYFARIGRRTPRARPGSWRLLHSRSFCVGRC